MIFEGKKKDIIFNRSCIINLKNHTTKVKQIYVFIKKKKTVVFFFDQYLKNKDKSFATSRVTTIHITYV